MDTKLIKNLIAVFADSGLTSLETSEEVDGKKFSIKLEKAGTQTVVAQVGTPSVSPIVTTPVPVDINTVGIVADKGKADYNSSTIYSPMVGIFYTSASPDSDAFVTVGSRVKKGDTLCIIEAMKLMNEIVAEQDGEIVEICVKNGELVEFSQALFRIL